MNSLANTLNKATIGDVAKKAGVSIKTVSRVANGLPNVSDRTRDKVQRAITALDYKANPYAKHLGSLRNAKAQAKVQAEVQARAQAKLAASSSVSVADLQEAQSLSASASARGLEAKHDIDWW